MILLIIIYIITHSLVTSLPIHPNAAYEQFKTAQVFNIGEQRKQN